MFEVFDLLQFRFKCHAVGDCIKAAYLTDIGFIRNVNALNEEIL